MNKDIYEGKWKQIRAKAKAWWGKLTNDDLDRAAGKYETNLKKKPVPVRVPAK